MKPNEETPPDKEKKAVPEKPKQVPPCPEEGWAGDKTPAVIAWWFEHYPQEAAVKYANRKIQLPATTDE